MRLSKLFFKISIRFWLSPFFPCFCLLYWSHLTLFRKEQYHMTTATISKKKTRRPRRILFILLPILLILVLGFSILFFLSHQNLLFQFRNNLAATFHQRSLPQTVSVSSYTIFMSHSSADGLLQNRQPDVLLIPTAGIMVLSSAIRPTEKSKLASLTNRGICAMSAFPIPRSSWTNI